MQSGFYRFEHSYLSRKGNKFRGPSKRGHLGAAANYYANTNKVSATLAINLPTDRRELMSALWSHDNTVTRANGRVAETLILSFDKRMSLEHRKEAAREFMVEVTFNEQIKAVAFLHDNDPANPHAHVIVLDADAKGEPVGHFGRSGTFRREHSPVKGNPTEWLRKQWEDSCNQVLAEHDYDFRVDRRSKLEQENELSRPQAPLEDVPREAETVETEADMENAVIAREGDRQSFEKVRDALDHDLELAYLRQTQQRVEYLKTRADELMQESASLQGKAKTTRETAQTAARVVERLDERLKDYTRSNGKLRGFHVKLLGLEWKSRTRQRAEFLSGEREHQELIAARDSRLAEEFDYTSKIRGKEATERMEEHQKLAAELRLTVGLYGAEATLETAEKILQNSIVSELKDVTPEEVYADFENGALEPGEAKRAFELMGQHAYILKVEAREQVEEEQMEGGIEL